MAEQMNDFWGDLDSILGETSDSPVLALLEEQAALLETKTNGRITAKVESLTGAGSRFMLRFVLVVPDMGGYRYELFKVVQRALDFPTDVVLGEQVVTCEDEAEYRAALEAALQSQATRTVLTNLLAAARNAVHP